MGVRVPVDVGPTRDAFEYEASQETVEVHFPLPAWADPGDVDVRLELKWFSVGLRDEAPYLECDLWGPIRMGECAWRVETSAAARDLDKRIKKALRRAEGLLSLPETPAFGKLCDAALAVTNATRQPAGEPTLARVAAPDT